MSTFREVHQRLGCMHGYVHGGLSDACRANRHEDCRDGECLCACHVGDDD